MGNIDLRAYVFLDSLQAQYAAFLGTVAQGFLPLAGDASLSIEVSPGIEINRLTDIALKSTTVKPGHADHRALLRHARDPLAVAGRGPRRRRRDPGRDRRWPRRTGSSRGSSRARSSAASTTTRPSSSTGRATARCSSPARRSTSWSWSRRPTPPLAANEAEKAAHINILEVRAFGSMGRIYLGGEERDIDVGWRAALAAIEGLEGREAKAVAGRAGRHGAARQDRDTRSRRRTDRWQKRSG